MKKGLTVFLLILVGLVLTGGLVIGAILELAEALVTFIVWTVIILVIYIFLKTRN